MGLIKAAIDAVGGGLADQWLEAIEADDMGGSTIFTSGTAVRGSDSRNSNRKGSANLVSNGSKIHVYPNQFMMLVDGGKIVDYTAEAGYYTVESSSAPSLFNGQLGDSVKETFNRVRFGGVTPTAQKVYFVNMQEIKGIKFGTPNPLNFFDEFYNAELYLRAFGTYSIKVTDPILFYTEVIPKNADKVEIEEINEQYLSEFLEAFQTALNQYSADGNRISHIGSKSSELGRFMRDVLDDEWKNMRGMEVQSVGVANISYDDESKELIRMRSQGAMLQDPSVREGYVQGSVARGMEAAGSNAGGSMAGFMGMGLGMQAGGGFMGAASSSNQQQMQQQQAQPPVQQAAPAAAGGWTCECGAVNTGKFCVECGKTPAVSGSWGCECGASNTGKFCAECGKSRPAVKNYRCNQCGFVPDNTKPIPKFCPECGDPINEEDVTE